MSEGGGEDFAEDVERCGFTSEGLELKGGLAKEHFVAGDEGGVLFLGLFEEFGHAGVVDGVENDCAGGEGDVDIVEGGGVGVGVHAQGCAVDVGVVRGGGELIEWFGGGVVEFGGECFGFFESAVVDGDGGSVCGEASDDGSGGSAGAEDGDAFALYICAFA